MSKLKIYVGKRIVDGSRVVIRSDVKPTEETHGDTYSICEGPFATIRGAKFYALEWNEGRQVTQDEAEIAACEESDWIAAWGGAS